MTTSQNRYSINGYVDTNKNVFDNIEALASAAGTWVTYDHNIGKWSVIINRAGSSVYSFNDDNIVGNISVTETSFDEMYNSVEIQFPHEDLLDQTDWVRIDIPTVDRLPNEPLNRLTIQTTLLNDPVQAEQIAITELKQSRVNKIVEFNSDFSTLGLSAGDIIDITNQNFGWNAKLFRIISVREEDDEDGNIVIAYTALEYSADVYDYSNLTRFARSRATGIKSPTINTEIQQSNDVDTGRDINRLLALAGLTSLFDLNNLFDTATGRNNLSLDSGVCLQPSSPVTGPSTICCNNIVEFSVQKNIQTINGCAIPENPRFAITNYVITGVNAADITIPLSGNFTAPGILSFIGLDSAGGKVATVNFRSADGAIRSTKSVGFTSGTVIKSILASG